MMFTVTTQKNRTVTTPQTSLRQHTQQQLESKQQLSKDTVEFQQQTKEQVAEQTQQILEQAKATHSPELQLLGINKALKKMQAQVAKETNQSLKTKQQQSLEQMLKENAEIRKELDEPTPVNNPDYPRPVTQLEEKLVDRLFQDLAHPDADLAQKAHNRLLSLGVSSELLDKITERLKTAKPAASNTVKFSGKTELGYRDCLPHPFPDEVAPWIKEAKQSIYFGKSSDLVIRTGVEHELETVQYSVEPVLFGAGQTVRLPNGTVYDIGIGDPRPADATVIRQW